jgi:CHAT domain-containing protein
MATTSQLQGTLRNRDIVLEYVTYTPGLLAASEEQKEQEHYGVFVVTADAKVAMKDLGPTSIIDQAILRYRELYNGQIEPRKFHLEEDLLNAQGVEVRRLLLDPALQVAGEAKLPPSKSRRIYVAPTGVVSLIPFEVLPQERKQEQGWRYLVEDYEVVYLAASRNLTMKWTQTPGSKDICIVANPDYNAAPSQHSPQPSVGSPPSNVYQDSIPNNWNRLDTGKFADFLERRTRELGLRSSVLRDADANEETILRLRPPRVLVFATHGYFMTDVAPTGGYTFKGSNITLKIGSLDVWGGFSFVVGAKKRGHFMDDVTRGDRRDGDWGADFKVSTDPLMRSMLVLAGANRRYHPVTSDYRTREVVDSTKKVAAPASAEKDHPRFDDGLLTAYEVETLHLQGTELVVLIGCESGTGVPQRKRWQAEKMTMAPEVGSQVEKGSLGNFVFSYPEATDEALTGLRRAFYIAGAQSIISSLWTVPLQESTQLIQDFTETWLGSNHGQNRYLAFHAAQLNALQRARDKGSSHPFWWAGFTFLGEANDAPVH